MAIPDTLAIHVFLPPSERAVLTPFPGWHVEGETVASWRRFLSQQGSRHTHFCTHCAALTDRSTNILPGRVGVSGGWLILCQPSALHRRTPSACLRERSTPRSVATVTGTPLPAPLAYARLGEREAARAARSAESSVEVYDEAPDEPPPGWIHYMNQAEVDCLAANAHTELALHADEPSRWEHYAIKAEFHSLRARQARGESYPRSRIFDEIRLAKVRLAQREPCESAAVGMNALNLADETRSSLVVDWLLRFDAVLARRYPAVAEVALFHEQLREYLRKAAPTRVGEL